MEFTHINEQGRARMVDVSEKAPTCRTALAEGWVLASPETLRAIRTGGVKKGDVLAVSQVAAIMAAKRTWELIPMCHPLMLTGVDVRFEPGEDRIRILAEVRCTGPTGVEMEALNAVSAAALTIYDMCKALQKDMEITGIRLLEKSGGKSGDYRLAPAGSARKGDAATVSAVCISDRKGIQKREVPEITLRVGSGIVGDAHAGNWHRQVSLLAEESVDEMRRPGLELPAGAFAENILTRGMELKTLPVGTVLRAGDALLAVTQIGKECHNDCSIKKAAGKCVMPTDGIFAVVLKDGTVRPGDRLELVEETL